MAVSDAIVYTSKHRDVNLVDRPLGHCTPCGQIHTNSMPIYRCARPAMGSGAEMGDGRCVPESVIKGCSLNAASASELRRTLQGGGPCEVDVDLAI